MEYKFVYWSILLASLFHVQVQPPEVHRLYQTK